LGQLPAPTFFYYVLVLPCRCTKQEGSCQLLPIGMIRPALVAHTDRAADPDARGAGKHFEHIPYRNGQIRAEVGRHTRYKRPCALFLSHGDACRFLIVRLTLHL